VIAISGRHMLANYPQNDAKGAAEDWILTHADQEPSQLKERGDSEQNRSGKTIVTRYNLKGTDPFFSPNIR
jgi:hypothetical protein